MGIVREVALNNSVGVNNKVRGSYTRISID